MHKPVTIYSTQTCGYCRAAKEYFTANDVAYTEVDVGSDQEKAKEMIEKSGQMGVPVIVVGTGNDEQIIVGFDQAKLAETIGITG